ncbi:hypothetical protein JD844_014470 [Phrynosoma platyrhinos]|uniref:Histidine decarboxylase n=1 Tax=Phrynosoma platyrhinos TaxID=52577 RepID=A0ABQ7SRL0_PHRPL|nr:hypothetical protein JD844_014470 [Phrynosoma platyrhinos]
MQELSPNLWKLLCLNLCLLLLPGKEMVDYICQYLTTVRERQVSPNVQPGYMKDQLPDRAPFEPESWDSIFKDIEKIIMPGVRAYSQPMASSPACTELEMNVMDWLAQMLGLPHTFLHYHPDSKGGGILQVSSSNEEKRVSPRKEKFSSTGRNLIFTREIKPAFSTEEWAYTEREATDSRHSDAGATGQKIQYYQKYSPPLSKLVSTNCTKEGLWLHVDAAYAATAFLCPEFRVFLNGIDYADSFTFNPSKWMMVHFDCTAFWVKDKYKLQQTFSVNPVYLRHPNAGSATDFMHWQIPLSRRFRSLKLWFVIRSFGVKKLQDHVRHGTEMAKYFESLVRSDPLFEIPAKRHLGLVVFRLKGPNWRTEKVLKDLNKSGKLFVIPAMLREKLIIRFTVTSQFTTQEDIWKDWSLIQQAAVKVVNLQHMPRFVGISEKEDQVLNKITSASPKSTGALSPFLSEEKGCKPCLSRITVQPRRGSLSSPPWLSNEDVPVSDDPNLDSCFVEDCSNAISHKLPAKVFIQNKKKTARSFSVPMADFGESCHLKTMDLDNSGKKKGPCTNEKFLSKLPKEMLMLKKSDLEKRLKFYSVPSFPECTIQCGLQLPCCPLQAIV